MRETAADLARLQDRIDASYAAAGPHQLRIHTPSGASTPPASPPSWRG